MTDWYKFWQKYRVIEINDEDDLLFQVGFAVHKKPLNKKLSSSNYRFDVLLFNKLR